ncbi:phage tail tube protein [Pseudomonadota bacterium]|nr:phage tail tube protein [Pseudomonadota bacterium]
MGQKSAGICYIKANSEQFEIKGGVEVPFNSIMREPIESLTNESGNFSEKGVQQFVKFSGILTNDINRKELTTNTDMTITVEFGSGKAYVLSGAYLSGEITAKLDDGEIDLVFHGSKGVWL